MNPECLCDLTSEETCREKRDKDEDGEETAHCNRIFLNFTRENRHNLKAHYNMVKVKDLFKYLSEREDLQEMKASGWREEEREEEEDDLEEEASQRNRLESLYDEESTPREGGQRFAMSRDFWYRKLNILKAQKLDEVALEAKDLPPEYDPKEPRSIRWIKNHKKYSTDVAEDPRKVAEDITAFDEAVAKPVEKELRRGFVNVYNNGKHLSRICPP